MHLEARSDFDFYLGGIGGLGKDMSGLFFLSHEGRESCEGCHRGSALGVFRALGFVQVSGFRVQGLGHFASSGLARLRCFGGPKLKGQ